MKYLLAVLLFFCAMQAYSSDKSASGKIARLSVYPQNDVQYRTIDVTGADNTGVNCYQSAATGAMSILIENSELGDSQYAMALASYFTDGAVRIKVDDTKKIGSHCTLELIQICKAASHCS